MKAIQTRIVPPTNKKPRRVKAWDQDGNRCFIDYPDLPWGEPIHRAAAEALCRKMGWTGAIHGGSVRHGYVFVFLP